MVGARSRRPAQGGGPRGVGGFQKTRRGGRRFGPPAPSPSGVPQGPFPEVEHRLRGCDSNLAPLPTGVGPGPNAARTFSARSAIWPQPLAWGASPEKTRCWLRALHEGRRGGRSEPPPSGASRSPAGGAGRSAESGGDGAGASRLRAQRSRGIRRPERRAGPGRRAWPQSCETATSFAQTPTWVPWCSPATRGRPWSTTRPGAAIGERALPPAFTGPLPWGSWTTAPFSDPLTGWGSASRASPRPGGGRTLSRVPPPRSQSASAGRSGRPPGRRRRPRAEAAAPPQSAHPGPAPGTTASGWRGRRCPGVRT